MGAFDFTASTRTSSLLTPVALVSIRVSTGTATPGRRQLSLCVRYYDVSPSSCVSQGTQSCGRALREVRSRKC